MNQLFVAAGAALIAITLFASGRRPRSLVKTNAFRASDLVEVSLVQPLKETWDFQSNANTYDQLFLGAMTPKDKIDLQKSLKKLISLGPEDRLLAVNIASQWGDASILPILRLGLKDTDNLVVAKSANAISKFKSCPPLPQGRQRKNYPLNVFLMR